ncbi:zinc ribbon domain-containing protein [Nostocales cyanobacterium LEGE 12452]|nr:zinc ribbon domain-containing protein [Nostocales cyanobacterium LEGE 12452]
MKCPQCQTENKAGSRFCISCGGSLQASTSPNVSNPPDDGIRGRSLRDKRFAQDKNPTIATLLSLLLAGLGQFYNGDMKKGLVMLIGGIILSFTVLGYLAILIWSMIDAYQVAKGEKSLWS